MRVEKPVSPQHCLQMLNENMNTTLLMYIHAVFKKRRDSGIKESPLETLIHSIEYTLSLCEQKIELKSLKDNPLNTNSRRYPRDRVAEYQDDIKLMLSQLDGLHELLAEVDVEAFQSHKRKLNSELTKEQIALAKSIHDHVVRIEKAGGGDEMLLVSLYDQMDTFKRLLDSSTREQIDQLSNQYPGFYRFAKLLESLAEAIHDGRVEVPKDH